MSDLLERQRISSAFFGSNAPFIEDLYEQFLDDPESINEDWRKRFESLPVTHKEAQNDVSHRKIQDDLLKRAKETKRCDDSGSLNAQAAERQAKVLRLINAYRVRGHQAANLDPLNLHEYPPLEDLQLSFYDLEPSDLDEVFNTGSLFAPDRLTLREIIDIVERVYTNSVGSEYMHITDTEEKRWIQQRLETYRSRPVLNEEDQRWILHLLSAAEGIEKFMHARYVGQKRFSLEGGESLIPALDEIIQRAGRNDMTDVVIGMAHRGRLNVLANILGKPPADIFEEFKGQAKVPEKGVMSSGDVKYHKGFSNDVDAENEAESIHISLGFNPSHLEIIGPVIAGSVRARQQRYADREGEKVLAVVIHGDAAFAGQGVVMETFNMSQARGFHVGGTVHIVINNQIGFTTSNVLDSRSTNYCTDVAKMVDAPIFHVNGDDPEAVIFVSRLALDYRNRFHKDVVIDLVCYRRHGHNEADEPAVTQPVMYHKIRNHQPTRAAYAEKLIAAGVLTPSDAQDIMESIRAEFEQGNCVGRPPAINDIQREKLDFNQYQGVKWDDEVDTSIDIDRLQELGKAISTIPDHHPLHARIQKIVNDRLAMANGDKLADWGFAENLAYATLLDRGHPVRLTGQDVRRGTFFHRHAMLRNQETGNSYVPLQHLSDQQPNFVVIDSVLSEEAVLAYEYGYATTDMQGLTLWEAQFGDFANGAQVVIDQFITSAGAKWGLYCGLVMLLPHGYEGQGAEHSSARLERYMQLCAEHNIQVCVPTTPAQIYHLLRRQMIRDFRHPLIVMTPKSLLRHPLATSSLDSLANGRFENIIDEVDPIEANDVTLVILCSGKVYYDLLQARRSRELKHVAIVRMEQLYPFPKNDFLEIVNRYENCDRFIWCQEEPQNQGAWDQIKHRFNILHSMNKEIYYTGRSAAAAPATGFHQRHQEEQAALVDEALNGHIDYTKNNRRD